MNLRKRFGLARIKWLNSEVAVLMGWQLGGVSLYRRTAAMRNQSKIQNVL